MCLGDRIAKAKPPRERVVGDQARERRETRGRRWGLAGRCRVLAVTLRDVGSIGRFGLRVV